MQFLKIVDVGYASKLCATAENDGFAGPIFRLQKFAKIIAGTEYCGPSYYQNIRSQYIPK